MFLKTGDWLRDEYLCIFCLSIPRQRALMKVLDAKFPAWRNLRIHESSPSGPASATIRQQCPGYLESQYFPDLQSGSSCNGIRCENLEMMSFADEMFDLVITQDVFEHVMRPHLAFAEIRRTLKPGGAHIFTVPLYLGNKSVTRATYTPAGVKHLMDPVFHSNPVDASGSLVVTDWGDDIIEFISSVCGMKTTVISGKDIRCGIDGEFLEVLISIKPATLSESTL